MAKAADGSKETGICFLCGQEKGGRPAKEDLAIRSARKIRSMLRLRVQRTVACPGCMAECAKRRAAFERGLKGYRLGAALFFILVAAGQLFFGKLDAMALAAGALGAAIILGLAYTAYCPAFPNAEEKPESVTSQAL